MCCDSYDVWYHQECTGLPDCIYDGLKNVSWVCFQCGVPNTSTSIFDTKSFETSNSFPSSAIMLLLQSQTLASATQQQNHRSQDLCLIGHDLPLCIIVLNCQSIKSSGKPAQLKNMITSLKADFVIGSESLLNSSIKPSEVFLDGFNCYRRDRPDGTGGGVFLLMPIHIDRSELEELKVYNNTGCKMVWAKVKIQGSADLYIGSINRPLDKGDQEYLQHLHSRIMRIPTDKGAHLWIGGDFNLPDIDHVGGRKCQAIC